jgi:hypothetical protein
VAPRTDANTKRSSKRARQRWTIADDELLDQEARDLVDQGKSADAVARLSETGVFFARHDTAGSLPCLCRRCLRATSTTAESKGIAFVRDFVVVRRRVLFYWMPEELARDAAKVRASMRTTIRVQLRASHLAKRRRKPVINPFTKEPIP